ncbi:phosphatidate cytidylyltransferase [Pedobacter montanisoli]|uniref:Phosphatidate cytidylyltransferase n=1 Tax=Pedobacter montanisoli TaxID=2923277 RepID=A0ABS9ZSZ6_9SPHI|nr:phosphatidate cytidylyltransferase [Pedobacter montanisoli]MCJ0741726.1 phosphatidate cytidylyltransferase [Pedobacter montanisoli]
MKTRAITAFFFTIVMLGSIFLGAYTFTAFYLLLSMVCLLEFYRMIKTTKIHPNLFIGVALAILCFGSIAASHFIDIPVKNLLLYIPLFFAVFIAELYRKSERPFSNIAFTFLGLIFVIVPFVFFFSLGFITNNSYSFHFPLAFLLMLWANDTGAYLFGMKFGKHRLFERHSPKKSWEGFFGGIFTGLIVAFIINSWFHEISLLEWSGMALIISCFGTLGDLVESMLKRSVGVKDSGNFLPGHGGFLDRFDGLLIAAPLVYTYLFWLLN